MYLRCIALSFLVLVIALPTPGQAQNFQTAQEAYEVGAAYIRSKNYPKAQEALEEALTLSPTEKLRGNIYRAVLITYQKDGDYAKFLAAADYIIGHPTSSAEKSLYRSQVVSFVRSRGKGQDAAERYEAMLKKNAKDPTVLYILSGIYADVLENPTRAAQLTERLTEVTKDAGGKVDVGVSTQLAGQYVKSGKFKEGAELYEKLADSDAPGKPHHLKDAAAAWLKAGDKQRARAVAVTASAGPPDKRSELLTHFWHRQLAEVLLATEEYALAVNHFQKAIDTTTIDGYRKDCQKKLEQAKAKLGK